MSARDVARLPGRLQFLERIGARRVEHPVPGRIAIRGDDERAIDETHYRVEHRPFVEVVVGGNALCRFECEAADEDAEPSEHDLLVACQQLVAPVERGVQGLLARRSEPVPARQYPEALFERGAEPAQAERRNAGGSELDGQGQAVELPTDVDGRLNVVVVEREASVGRLRTVDEEGDRAVREGLRPIHRTVGKRQTAEPKHALGFDAERHLAGDDDVQGGRGVHQLSSQAGHRIDEVLDVVEREQHLARGDRIGQAACGVAGAELDAEGRRDDERQCRFVTTLHSREVDEGGALPARRQQVPHEVRLADAARSDDADDAMLLRERPQGDEPVLASDQR